jgi:hypothetical protein
VALRQRDRDLARAAPVELGRPARTRALPSGQPPELGLEQAFLDQPVQVELGGVRGTPTPAAAWSRLTGSGSATTYR